MNACLHCRPRRTSFDASNRATRSSPETSTVPKCCRNCGTRLSACSRRLRTCGDVTAARFPSDSFPQGRSDRRLLLAPTRRTACPFPLTRSRIPIHSHLQNPPLKPAQAFAAAVRAPSRMRRAHAALRAGGGRVPAQMWPSPGADVAQSRRRCGRVPAQMSLSPSAAVAESRRRCGSVPAQMWPSPGADVAQSRRRCG
jgi:hypothetical protein